MYDANNKIQDFNWNWKPTFQFMTSLLLQFFPIMLVYLHHKKLWSKIVYIFPKLDDIQLVLHPPKNTEDNRFTPYAPTIAICVFLPL